MANYFSDWISAWIEERRKKSPKMAALDSLASDPQNYDVSASSAPFVPVEASTAPVGALSPEAEANVQRMIAEYRLQEEMKELARQEAEKKKKKK